MSSTIKVTLTQEIEVDLVREKGTGLSAGHNALAQETWSYANNA